MGCFAWGKDTAAVAQKLMRILNQSADIDSYAESQIAVQNSKLRQGRVVQSKQEWVSQRARPGKGNLPQAGAALLRP